MAVAVLAWETVPSSPGLPTRTETLRFETSLCDAVAALPFTLTASVGTASVYSSDLEPTGDDPLVELISAADAAMYVAKRRGGNRACHHPSSQAGYVSDELSA